VRAQEEITIRVPPGVMNGNYIPLRKLGDAGVRGGPPGDLIAHIEEIEHPVFARDGEDLIVEVPISAARAALGGKIEVPTLGGKPRWISPRASSRVKCFGCAGRVSRASSDPARATCLLG